MPQNSFPPENSSREQATKNLEDHAHKAKTAFLWLASTNVAWQLISWGLTIFTARLLLPTDYGIMAMIGTLTPYLESIAGLSLSSWIIQTERLEKHDEESIFTLSVLFGTLITILAFFLANYVSGFYDRADITLALQIVSLIFIIRGISTVPEGKLKRELRFKSIGIMNLVVGLMRAVLIFVLAWLGYGYWSLLIGHMLQTVMSALWLCIAGGLPRRFAFDAPLYRRAIAYGLPATGATIFWMIFSTADNIVVGKLFGAEVLGFYAMAFFLTDLPMAKMNSVLNPVLFPYFSRLRAQSEKLPQAFLSVVRNVNMLGFPVMIGLFVVAPEAVALILGPHWLPLVTPLRVMCFVGILRAFTDQVSPFLLAIGKPKELFYIRALSVAIMPAAFYGLGLRFGVWGVFGAWLAVYPIIPIVILFVLDRLIGLSPKTYCQSLVPALVSVLLMGLAASSLRFFPILAFPPWRIFLAQIACGVAVYALSLYALFPGAFESFLQMLRKKNVPTP